jgi:heme-degrading monooxygenase HmoA
MFASIRTYTIEGSTTTDDAYNKTRQMIERDFLPQVQDIPGFHGYYLLRGDKNRLTTISLFDREAGAAESVRRAAEYTRTAKLPFKMGAPEVIHGEVLFSREMASSHR